MARERHGAGNVALVHASYGQRTQARERRAFEEIAEFWGVCERLMVKLDHFRSIGGSALTDTQIAVPENEFTERQRTIARTRMNAADESTDKSARATGPS